MWLSGKITNLTSSRVCFSVAQNRINLFYAVSSAKARILLFFFIAFPAVFRFFSHFSIRLPQEGQRQLQARREAESGPLPLFFFP